MAYNIYIYYTWKPIMIIYYLLSKEPWMCLYTMGEWKSISINHTKWVILSTNILLQVKVFIFVTGRFIFWFPVELTFKSTHFCKRNGLKTYMKANYVKLVPTLKKNLESVCSSVYNEWMEKCFYKSHQLGNFLYKYFSQSKSFSFVTGCFILDSQWY